MEEKELDKLENYESDYEKEYEHYEILKKPKK
jgi:hypothetical protein